MKEPGGVLREEEEEEERMVKREKERRGVEGREKERDFGLREGGRERSGEVEKRRRRFVI